MFKQRSSSTKGSIHVITIDQSYDIVAVIEALRFNPAKLFNLIVFKKTRLFLNPFHLKLLKDIEVLLKKRSSFSN